MLEPENVSKESGIVWHHFQETPMPISTYLIAFVVSDFTNLSSSDGFYSTWQREAAIGQAQYSIEVTPRLMSALEAYTGLEYFLPKLDQVAVPDFDAGAMENWGLITYREQLILYVEGVSRAMDKQNVATIIAHELAHKWFGNLVSPKWWKYLWLNEGFATFFEYFTTASVETSWRLDHQFVPYAVQSALSSDSLQSSHPMTVDVGSPNEISAIFSTVSYSKAGSVIRMIEHCLTPETFRQGISQYVANHGNQTAEPDYLFRALQEQYENEVESPGFDVKTVLDTWSTQKGYPVITVTRNYSQGQTTVQQERFLRNMSESPTDTHDYKCSLVDVSAASNEWILFNIQETGFYRVNYDARNWALLTNYLNSESFTNIHVLNRAQLLDDAFNLARAGVLNYGTALSLTKYLSRETDYIPWYSALTGFNYLDRRIRGMSEYDHHTFKKYVLRLFETVNNTLGFEEQETDSHTTKINRNLIMSWLCNYEVKSCTDYATREFAALMNDPDSYYISPNLKSVVYCNGLRFGGEEEWDFLWNRYLNHNVNTEQVIILGVLGCTKNETLAHRMSLLHIGEFNNVNTEQVVILGVLGCTKNESLAHCKSLSWEFLAAPRMSLLHIGEFNNVNTEQVIILGVLGCTKNEILVHRYLRTTITADSGVRSQDYYRIYPSVYNNPYGVEHAISFLEENYLNIYEYNNNSTSSIISVISGISDVISTQEQVDRVKEFIANELSQEFDSNVTTSALNSLRTAENNLLWLNTYGSTIMTWIKQQDYRLPTGIVPDNYYVVLKPNLDGDTFQFEGRVNILINVTENTDRITLHADDIEIDNTTIDIQSITVSAHIVVETITYDSLRQFYDFKLDQELVAGRRYRILLFYRGYHREDMSGFYRSYYVKDNERSELEPNIEWDNFEETPMPISTYLIAFVVSDFVNLSSSDGFYSTWQRADAISQAQYSIDVSPLIMKSLENFTELDYFLPKMDQVAVPDFSAGAMENWGLVTYREQYILHEEGVSTSINKQNVATIIAHEFAHKWFGNLVSPTWWRYTWLNEGFARYFEFFTTHSVETTWRMEDQFVVRQVHTSLSSDSLESAHALSVDVGSPSSICGNRTAEPDDLFAILDSQYLQDFPNRPVSVKTVMDTWTLQSGHPVITITRNYISGALTVTQERFYLRRSGDSTDTHDYKTWMDSASSQITINNFGASANDWVIFNVQQIGFYRVNYDARNWALLTNYLNSESFTNIHVLNRAQLLDDAFNLARAEILDYTTALEITKYLSRETDYIPWFSALTGFTYLDRRFRGYGDYNYTVFKSYLVGLLSTTYQTLSLEEGADDDHTTKLNRNLILTWLCNYGVEDCTNMAKSEFNKLLLDSEYRVTPDLKTVVYCNALRYGGEEEWNFLWNRYLTHNVNTEQVLILGVLGCTRNETLAHRYLRKTITSDSGIRSQDISSVYPSVYNNIYGVDFAINFLSQNFRDIIEFNASVPSVVAGIAGAISSQEQLNKLEQFINDNADELGSSTTTSALNNIQTARINLEWLNTHGSTIMTWIKQQNYRLPTHIVPYHYNVVLQPNLDDDTFQFTGRVEISFNVTETTDRVQLHADDLEIDNTTIAVEPLTIWGEFDNFTTTVDSLRHIYDIKLSDYLLTGHRYRLHLNYKGYHREDMAGFYRSYYYRNGVKRWLASTQFQATSARRAFPCFDEPALKARFKVSVARTPDRHVLSNMPLENSEYDDVTGLWWDHFQETPMPMSTYLVAFVVSDFVNLTSDDGKYSTWQRSDAVDQAQYSIDVSPSVMAALENFTELDYFLPKVDQVAIPDFSAGAMENWGLVTYRERNILLVEGVTPFSYKRFVLQVIAHEFAHKWFGNLVSPLWWRYLWISEGFARYFQYFTPAEVEPDWRMEEQFVVDQVHSSLISDSLANTHAMSSDVGSPSDIRTIFGTISYNKGLSVKTVLDTWSLQEGYPLITVSRIYDSSNIYRSVTVHQSELNFNSTTTRDWLRASQENSLITDININSTEWVIFNIQETAPSYTSIEDNGFYCHFLSADFGVLVKFLSLDDLQEPQPGTSHDPDPVPITTPPQIRLIRASNIKSVPSIKIQPTTRKSRTGSAQLITGSPYKQQLSESQKKGPLPKRNGFYRVNYDDTNWNLIISFLNSDQFTDIHVLLPLYRFLQSFYRVNYDDTNWNLIISHLNSDQFTDIHVLNRAQLLDDSLNLARAGILDYNTALNLTLYLTRETDYIPWYTALSSFTFLDRRLRGLGDTEYSYFKDYVLRIMETAGQVLGLSEETNESLVTKLHRNQILTWQCNFGVQSCIDMASSELVKLMDDPDNYLVAPDLKTVVYCNALRYGGEEEWNFLWNRYLTHNVNTEQVLILGVLGCTRNETLAHSNGGVDLLATILTGIADHVSTRDQAEEIRSFIEENQANLGTALGASQRTLETVEENLAWLDQNGGEISNWLSVSLPSTTPAPPLTTPPGGAGSFSASVVAITVSLIMTCVRFV
uniref:Aminopeptidase N n=1 Tax=Timema douglasi TaxID=61478 RepID=A0A7R8VRB0_TIMDO|nr:unnamed protein product [Timema douglasi]